MSEQQIETKPVSEPDFLDLTVQIASAFAGSPSNSISHSDLPNLISNIHATLVGLGAPKIVEEVRKEPAVAIRSSVKPDYIVCLEDGKKLKMLKRHLMTHYQMTPDQYRQKWGLSADYPMIAPNYAEQRRALAKKIGLGTVRTRSDAAPTRRRAAAAVAAATAAAAAAPAKRRGRPPKAATTAPTGRGRRKAANA